MTCANKASPLLLPWENVTVTSDGRTIRRGIPLGFGSPEQLMSLKPSTGDPDIWLFDIAQCNGDPACIGTTGGFYNSSASVTVTEESKQAWNGSLSTASRDAGNYTYFNDILHFNHDTFVSGFPFYMMPSTTGSQSGLGLGPNSTFLDAAVKSNIAPTRNWGLWAGSRSVVEPVDGSLCVGGYDSNRLSGEFTTFTQSRKCSSCAKVTNLTYITQSDSRPLFGDQTEAFWVQISPWYNTMALPADIFQTFQLAINGTFGVDPGTTDLLTVPNDAELGNINITLQGGYTTVIPAREIFAPPRQFTEDGIYEISNDTYLISLIVNATLNGYSPPFGIPFLTMNYMTMDFDWEVFSLAPARQGPYSGSEGPSIQPLCEGAASNPSGSAQPTPTDLQSLSNDPKGSGTNVAIIAGSVVGGVVGLALIGFLIWFILLRRIRKRKSQESYEAVSSQTENAPKQEGVIRILRQESNPRHVQMPAASLDRNTNQDLLHYQQIYDQFYQQYNTATYRNPPLLMRINDRNNHYQ